MTTGGRAVLLTGASRGLGVLMAHALAERGLHLALAARSEGPLRSLAAALSRAGSIVVPIAADVTTEEGRRRIVSEAEHALGGIDVLVNNAGVESGGAFATQDPSAVRQILTTNVEAPMLLARAVLPGMLARRAGHIVNVASLAGKLGLPFASVYGASKAAMLAWSRALRFELEGTGVVVSALSPGYVSGTGMWAEHKQAPHWLTGESPPAAVVQGLLRLLDRREEEVMVNPRPLSPLMVLHALAPRVAAAALRRAGFVAFTRSAQSG